MEYSEKTSYNRGGEVSKALLRRYYQYLKLERGLSGNTLDAYTEDLRKLLGFLWEGGLDFRTVSVDDLHQFVWNPFILSFPIRGERNRTRPNGIA